MKSGPFEMTPADIARWMDQEQGKLFLEWLTGQIELYRRKIAERVLANDIDKARTATGGLYAYQEIHDALLGSAAPPRPAEPEPAFTDPAERFSQRRKIK